MSVNGCVCERACLRVCTSASVNVCEVLVVTEFSIQPQPSPAVAALHQRGLSHESLLIIFASPGVHHLASVSAGCSITPGAFEQVK